MALEATRLVLVTGASRGIGAAIARHLAAAGKSVVAAARTQAACEGLCDELHSAHGVLAIAVRMDVGDPRSIREAVEEAQRRTHAFGPIDGLVNDAGVALSAPLLGNAEGELHELHMRVNYHGARRVAEALLPDMRARGRGAIVNVASSAGLRGYPYVSAYCASKHALVGWTRAAALELAETGVRVHAVCPHYVESPMLAESVRRIVAKTGKSEADARAFFADQNPGGRLVTPEEVAREVARLLDSEKTGEIVELDGSA